MGWKGPSAFPNLILLFFLCPCGFHLLPVKNFTEVQFTVVLTEFFRRSWPSTECLGLRYKSWIWLRLQSLAQLRKLEPDQLCFPVCRFGGFYPALSHPACCPLHGSKHTCTSEPVFPNDQSWFCRIKYYLHSYVLNSLHM